MGFNDEAWVREPMGLFKMELEMKHRLSRAALAAAVSGLLVSGSALAVDVNANLSVTATVSNSCTVSAANLAFGVVSPTADTDVQTTISWQCTTGHPATIKLGAGGSTNIMARRMTAGGTTSLPYQLYTNSTRTSVFGDGVTGNSLAILGAGFAATTSTTVYGRVPTGAVGANTAGAYTDTVQITVTF
jgi:spore coat protein U domain-containing protein, fimbrial subunit CupE1/2/3/6